MRKNALATIFAGTVFVGLFVMAQRQTAAQRAPQLAQLSAPAPVTTPLAETSANGTRINSPETLTYKALSNPYCYQPNPAVDQCFINIRYYQAADNGTSAPIMQRIKISINNKIRLVENLFFENNIYYSYDMAPGGIQVACGAPNAGGGGADYGNSYFVAVDPIDNMGASMGFDQASLLCPAYAP